MKDYVTMFMVNLGKVQRIFNLVKVIDKLSKTSTNTYAITFFSNEPFYPIKRRFLSFFVLFWRKTVLQPV